MTKTKNILTVKDIKKIRYPDLNTIVHFTCPEILLGREIYFEEKRDGSNLGVWLDKNNKLHARSRNMDKASKDIISCLNRTEEAPKLIELMIELRDKYNKQSVIFGELLQKGKSPTRLELHEKEEFVMFDIWEVAKQNFISYIQVHQYGYQYKIPVVELYGTSKHSSMESLYAFRDKMLDIAKSKGREEVVGKTFGDGDKEFIYFKEKLDTPHLDKLPREIDGNAIIFPELEESELLGALDKVLTDLGFDKFKDKNIAMPMFAKYVSFECKKHLRVCRAKLFMYYNAKLEELKQNESNTNPQK